MGILIMVVAFYIAAMFFPKDTGILLVVGTLWLVVFYLDIIHDELRNLNKKKGE